jgi:hypothetical protein
MVVVTIVLVHLVAIIVQDNEDFSVGLVLEELRRGSVSVASIRCVVMYNGVGVEKIGGSGKQFWRLKFFIAVATSS